jgi:hypothetical protein
MLFAAWRIRGIIRSPCFAAARHLRLLVPPRCTRTWPHPAFDPLINFPAIIHGPKAAPADVARCPQDMVLQTALGIVMIIGLHLAGQDIVDQRLWHMLIIAQRHMSRVDALFDLGSQRAVDDSRIDPVARPRHRRYQDCYQQRQNHQERFGR